LLRDTPFAEYPRDATAIAAAKELSRLGDAYAGPRDADGQVSARTLFRGGLRKDGKCYFAGQTWGPYVSQFLLHPANLGAQPLDQMFLSHRARVDYLTDEKDWEWVQKGGFPSGQPQHDRIRRHLRDGRGLSAYAHADETIQPYLVAHLIMQTAGLRGNADSPYLGNRNEKPFATFGAPDVVGTLGAVARAALIAAGHQKWNVHLRHRPESGGGLVHLAKTQRAEGLLRRQSGESDGLHEVALGSAGVKLSHHRHGSYLLSQAYPEGAPAEPSYPSGHAAVAGACITALKFFYDCERPIVSCLPVLTPSNDGLYLKPYQGLEAAQMTFNSELGKLGHNVSFGRGLHAGVNWRSDVDAGMLLGEEVAIAFLKDQAAAYRERFAVKLRKFDGGLEAIGNKS
jgi:membrane-associated phospholipid phosphatase